MEQKCTVLYQGKGKKKKTSFTKTEMDFIYEDWNGFRVCINVIRSLNYVFLAAQNNLMWKIQLIPRLKKKIKWTVRG